MRQMINDDFWQSKCEHALFPSLQNPEIKRGHELYLCPQSRVNTDFNSNQFPMGVPLLLVMAVVLAAA